MRRVIDNDAYYQCQVMRNNKYDKKKGVERERERERKREREKGGIKAWWDEGAYTLSFVDD